MRLRQREFDHNTLTSSFSVTSAYLHHADNWVHVDVTRLFATQFTRCRQKPSFFKRRNVCIVSEWFLRLLFDRQMDTALACQRMPDVFLTQRLSPTRPHEAGLSVRYIYAGINSSIQLVFCMVLIESPPCFDVSFLFQLPTCQLRTCQLSNS